MGDTTLQTAVREMPVYVAMPTRPPPWPGVVVLHDAFGMSEVLRRHADWLAGEGYLAAAPNLYRSGRRLSAARAVFRDAAAGSGPTFDDVEATRTWLASQPGCNGKIGAVGFCMGGGLALLLTSGHGISAVAVNYGRLPKDPEATLAAACPVVASYGAKDRSLHGAAARLAEVLAKKGVPHDVKEYPGANHCFLDDFAPGDVPRPVLALMKLMGVGYRREAAEDARRRILAFFETHLKAAA